MSKKIHEELKSLYLQKQHLEEEIKKLEAQLEKENKNTKKNLTKDQKIELFKALFVNRSDIFAKKWISKDGKKQGFYPVTQTFRGNDFIPISNKEIELHLRGQIQLASYILNKTNLCKYIIFELLEDDILKLEKICIYKD